MKEWKYQHKPELLLQWALKEREKVFLKHKRFRTQHNVFNQTDIIELQRIVNVTLKAMEYYPKDRPSAREIWNERIS